MFVYVRYRGSVMLWKCESSGLKRMGEEESVLERFIYLAGAYTSFVDMQMIHVGQRKI